MHSLGVEFPSVGVIANIVAALASLAAIRAFLLWFLPRFTSGRTRFVTANGIEMQYVDWGGHGEALLLLPGLGNDAYVFYSFARGFTDRFRVLALTRRGFGRSQKPENGYDVSTRVEDIRAFLDELKIRQVNLVGHSMAGDEMTMFAARHPGRVIKLVYLDAAIDRYHTASEMCRSDPAATRFARRLCLELKDDPHAQQITVLHLPRPEIWRATVECMKATDEFRPDYQAIEAPALAIYAMSEVHPRAAYVWSSAKRKVMNSWYTANVIANIRRSMEQFKREMRFGKVVEMPNADHFLFVGKTRNETVTITRAFLLESS